jgi:hypothetical protein
MAHAHHHDGESLKNYFTEQLLTLLVCGAFGYTAIQLYREDRLVNLLVDLFHPWVLWGGIAILAMVVFRMIAVWKEAGEYQANAAHAQGDDCNQDHVHGADCSHVNIPGQDEEDHDHSDHGHSHDMSWFFARMLILFFPVALFFLGLPSQSLSMPHSKETEFGGNTLKDLAKDATQEGDVKNEGNGVSTRILKTKTGLKIRETKSDKGEIKLELMRGEGAIGMKFSELNDAAYDAGKREGLQGEVVVLEGHFRRLADKEFSLYRLKMTCCAADAVPLRVRIVVPQALSGHSEGDWLEVKGQLQFLKEPGKESYIPVLMVADLTDIKKKSAPRNEME